jgi:hypothetical protein
MGEEELGTIGGSYIILGREGICKVFFIIFVG